MLQEQIEQLKERVCTFPKACSNYNFIAKEVPILFLFQPESFSWFQERQLIVENSRLSQKVSLSLIFNSSADFHRSMNKEEKSFPPSQSLTSSEIAQSHLKSNKGGQMDFRKTVEAEFSLKLSLAFPCEKFGPPLPTWSSCPHIYNALNWLDACLI